jgi:hypothetical protein
MVEPRIGPVVAIATYANLSNAVMNLRQEYAAWLPKTLVKSGLNQLPVVLGVAANELDTTTEMTRSQVGALFVAGGADEIMPKADVEQLYKLAAQRSKLIIVPDATHETVTYYMGALAPPVLTWLTNKVEPYNIVGMLPTR